MQILGRRTVKAEGAARANALGWMFLVWSRVEEGRWLGDCRAKVREVRGEEMTRAPGTVRTLTFPWKAQGPQEGCRQGAAQSNSPFSRITRCARFTKGVRAADTTQE